MKALLNLFLSIVIPVLLLIGEIKCIIHLFMCDFEPSYKAEWIYCIGACTGLGSIIGWFDFGV
jgi:hypothetical protein